MEAGLAEVLGDDDVGGELRPVGRDLDAVHLEDDRAVGVVDGALPTFPENAVERVLTGPGEVTLQRETFGFSAPRALLGWALGRLLSGAHG